MIPFALDEVIAMGQFVYWSHCHGKPLIRTFFKGDAVDKGEEYTADALESPSAAWAEAKQGMTLPWTLAASIAVGAFLMLTRLTFGTEGAMANSDPERKTVVEGKRVSVRVDHGGRRIIKKKHK